MDANAIFLLPLLTGILLTAALYDVRFRRIPNWLTYPGIIIGIICHTAMKGMEGLAFSLEGLGVGFGIMVIIYLMGGTGAGDVKLMAAIGGFLGPKGTFVAFLFTSIVGGIYAIMLLFLSGYLKETINRHWSIFKTFILTKKFIYLPPSENEKKPKLCYAIAIALGTLFSVVGKIF
jgi:prepilin peptidase CpaA